jgi:hypothetical protein
MYPLEVDEWEDNAAQYSLTIGDIMNLNKGDQIKILSFNRNYLDTVCGSNEENKTYCPEVFFKKECHTYIHEDGLKGKMFWNYGEDSDFEFEIEYEQNHWYPLRNGYLPKEDPMLSKVSGNCKAFCGSFSYSKPKHWSTFPRSTRIGWRGPIMLWKDVNEQPNVYWSNNADENIILPQYKIVTIQEPMTITLANGTNDSPQMSALHKHLAALN